MAIYNEKRYSGIPSAGGLPGQATNASSGSDLTNNGRESVEDALPVSNSLENQRTALLDERGEPLNLAAFISLKITTKTQPEVDAEALALAAQCLGDPSEEDRSYFKRGAFLAWDKALDNAAPERDPPAFSAVEMSCLADESSDSRLKNFRLTIRMWLVAGELCRSVSRNGCLT